MLEVEFIIDIGTISESSNDEVIRFLAHRNTAVVSVFIFAERIKTNKNSEEAKSQS